MNAVMNATPGERAQLLPFLGADNIAEAHQRWAGDAVNSAIAQKMTPEPAPEGAAFEVPDATVAALRAQVDERDIVIGPDGASIVARAYTIEDARTAKLADLKARRDATRYATFEYPAGSGIRYQCDKCGEDDIRGKALGATAGTSDLPIEFLDKSNTLQTFATHAEFKAMAATMERRVDAIFAHYVALRIQLQASADPANFDIDSGWPTDPAAPVPATLAGGDTPHEFSVLLADLQSVQFTFSARDPQKPLSTTTVSFTAAELLGGAKAGWRAWTEGPPDDLTHVLQLEDGNIGGQNEWVVLAVRTRTQGADLWMQVGDNNTGWGTVSDIEALHG